MKTEDETMRLKYNSDRLQTYNTTWIHSKFMLQIMSVALTVALMVLLLLMKKYLQALKCSTDHKSSEYRLPPLFIDRATTEHMLPIPFWHSLTHSQTKSNILRKVYDTTEHTGLD